MAISDQISRIQEARDKIREKEKDMGIVNSTESPNLTLLAERLEGITVVDNLLHEIDGLDGEYVLEPGYYKGGTISVKGSAGDYKLTSLGSITPSTSAQVFDPSTYSVYGFSKFTVDKIPKKFGDITTLTTFTTSDELLSGKQVIVKTTGADNQPEAVRITGTMTNNGNVTSTLSRTQTFYTIPKGYHAGGGQVNVAGDFIGSDITRQAAKTITPTKSTQPAVAANVYTTGAITVGAIPDKYQDVTTISGQLDSIGENVSFVNHNGTQVTGKAPIVEGETYQFNALVDAYFNIPNGLYIGTSTGTTDVVIMDSNYNRIYRNWEQTILSNGYTGYKVPFEFDSNNTDIISAKVGSTEFGCEITSTGIYVCDYDENPPGQNLVVTITYSNLNGGSKVEITSDLENALAAI